VLARLLQQISLIRFDFCHPIWNVSSGEFFYDRDEPGQQCLESNVQQAPAPSSVARTGSKSRTKLWNSARAIAFQRSVHRTSFNSILSSAPQARRDGCGSARGGTRFQAARMSFIQNGCDETPVLRCRISFLRGAEVLYRVNSLLNRSSTTMIQICLIGDAIAASA